MTGATPSPVVATGTILADDVGPAILTTAGVAYTQNFDALANTGTTNLPLLTGWFLAESGGGARDNELYAADNGGSNTGDTYSYGAEAAPSARLARSEADRSFLRLARCSRTRRA